MELVESYLKANSLDRALRLRVHPGDHRRRDGCPRWSCWILSSSSSWSRACATSSKTSARVRPCRRRLANGESRRRGRRKLRRRPRSRRTAAFICLPARAERDELAGAMLVQLLRQQGFAAQNASAKLVAGELLALVEKADVDVVCISVVPPSTVIHARYLCLKLRALLPKQKIVVGLWGATEDLDGSGQTPARFRRR